MDEESAVKAPVTRLRRRLSIEQTEDVNSPGPATPTKKRGRLAAKPQLELIDENESNGSAKRSTRKPSVKEIVEAAEEKPVTPSRRSTRIKSNTSLVSEPTQAFDSPRAKRAARRTSQVGSDSESAVTPVRQTRRTRKDSTSSIEKLEVTLSGKPTQITEVIIEEDTNSIKSDDTAKGNNKTSNTPIRKSPRLKGKKERKSTEISSNESDNRSSETKISLEKEASKIEQERSDVLEDEIKTSPKKLLPKKGLEPEVLLVKELDKQPQRKKSNLNKSTSALEDHNNFLKKRQRTKSWTITSHAEVNDGAFYSDNEITKNKLKKGISKGLSFETNHTGSGDSENNNKTDLPDLKTQSDLDRSIQKVNNIENSFTANKSRTSKEFLSPTKSFNSEIKSLVTKAISPQGNKENIINQSALINESTKILKSASTPKLQSIIYFEDSDAASKNEENLPVNSEDQCVPVIDSLVESGMKETSENGKKSANNSILKQSDDVNISCEPMDIDETMPNNISLSEFSPTKLNKSSNSKVEDIQDSSTPVVPFIDSTLNTSSNKSKRKSSVSKMGNIPEQTLMINSQLDNTLNKSLNKSERRLSESKIENVPEQTSRVCSLSGDTLNNSSNKSRRKSSASKTDDILELESDICLPPMDNTLNKSSNKSKRKSSVSKTDDILEQETGVCSPLMVNTLNKSSNKSKRKSSVSQTDDILELEMGVCSPLMDNTLNKSSNKSKRKSSVSKTDDKLELETGVCSPLMDNTLNKSSNKSKRKSSLSNSQNFEKSETENKTTLILSQIKDVSSSEDAVPKTPTLSNEILSKSVGTAGKAKDKALDTKNLSHDYSTSTPLQQKKFQKLGMHINSSIKDSSSTEFGKEKARNESKKNRSQVSKKSEITSEDESDSEIEEESSKDQSNLLDDEAEVASDDYESGDSQDDEERQYAEENEIVERGETLDSDDDDSNDTDYEKDSFVVSSNEEDNELLSGSGDDLSMSDKELSMSKKSKKKYDERKQREQKMASREMYEARHKLDTSATASKSKKQNKRQQIESSEDSDEEVKAPAKRNKHLRLDSTQYDDLDQSSANKSLTKKKSKTKRLSESIHDESVVQEREMTTICDNSLIQNNDDPLSIQVKLEPKTPMKDLNISTVQINENVEEVQVDGNASVMNTNETMDPLQATMLEGENSSMSENSEIANNYDSILKELNSSNKTKNIKTLDISLNLNKKSKHDLKEPIIDQLNLTKTKTSKKKKKLAENVIAVDQAEVNKSQNKNESAIDADSSSDSIDLQLLFSEDSNDNNEVDDETAENEKAKDTDADDFIPLKRTPGKTNILTNRDQYEISVSNTTLSESAKKKKRKSQQASEELNGQGQTNNDEIQIIIDTQGTYENTEKSLDVGNSTAKKNRNSITVNKDPEMSNSVMIDKDDEAPLEVPYESTKSKKKNRKTSETKAENQDMAETSVNMSLNSSGAKKKKKSVSESHVESTDIIEENNANVSLKMGSEKKKKKRLSETLNAEANDPTPVTEALNISVGSAKKKKEKAVSENDLVQSKDTFLNDNEEFLNKSKKRKRNSSAGEPIENASQEDQGSNQKPNTTKISNESSPNVNLKKKRKISQGEDKVVSVQDAVPKKKNKKRKERDDEDGNVVSKMFKENSFDKVRITRLPSSVLNQLEDKPSKEDVDLKRSNLVSTTAFVVEDTRKRRNNPSKFLEESVYLNDTHIEKKPKGNIKKPKVLPFLPTAVTSGSGFTTNFKINIIPQEVQFVAQTKNTTNFKNDYLYGKNIKRLGTYETYKKHRSAKMSKF